MVGRSSAEPVQSDSISLVSAADAITQGRNCEHCFMLVTRCHKYDSAENGLEKSKKTMKIIGIEIFLIEILLLSAQKT